MNWTEIAITTNSSGIEPITGALLNIGINGIRVENKDDFNEFLEGTQTYWDYVDEDLMYLADCETRVILYLPENTQGYDMLVSLKQALNDLKSFGDFGSLEITTNNIKEEDWENNWKQFFKPFSIGDKFLIKPTWEQIDNAEERKVLEIDPGMSFGTGTHETTQLCLEAMENIINENDNVLDLGCGSGILSIGACLLGASHITLVDIDENSVEISKENIQKNNISTDNFTAYCGNIIDNENLRNQIGFKKYDVILANIVADVLKAMSGFFKDFLKDNGKLIVSGIISERRDEVVNEITKYGFKVINIHERGYWSCVELSI